MASTDKELEEQLLEAGNKLLNPPSSVSELLPLLDEIENGLSRVEQSPSKSMQSALAPSQQALVAEQLFKHSDIDVKVAVASCISEITRITAPEAPYDDNQMKDVFQLIVSSFENLSDKSSRSYGKRTSILETVAKVRSCVVMLDLECEELIIEMFEHFLKAIRDFHPENVFSSMETIMSLVLEESEDISPELLSPLLASVNKNNNEILPIACKLGEKVLESCATKVKPYLTHTVKSLGVSLDEYSDIVSSICQEMTETGQQNDVHSADENKVEEVKPVRALSDEAVQASDEATQANKEITSEAGSPKQDAAINKTPKSPVSNGVTQTGEDNSLADLNCSQKQEDGSDTNQVKHIDSSSNAEPDISDAEKLATAENEAEQTTKNQVEKPNSSTKSTEPSDNSDIDAHREKVTEPSEKVPDETSDSKDVPSSPHKAQSVVVAVTSDRKKEADSQPSSKTLEGESKTVALSSVSESLLDEHSEKDGQPKNKDSLTEEAAPSSQVASESEAKVNKRSGRKAPAGISNEGKTTSTMDLSKKESGTASESEAKPAKQSSKEVDTSSNNDNTSAIKQSEDKKQNVSGKAISEKNVTKSSTKDDAKEKVSSLKSVIKSTKDEDDMEETPKTRAKRKRTPIKENEKVSSLKSIIKSTKDEDDMEETPKTSAKRKRAPIKEKGSDTEEYGQDIVGLKVKVWWPRDRTFYEGVIDSYDSGKKKHLVLYNDGDQEILNLKRERWEIIKDDSESDKGEAAQKPSPDSSSEMPLKKIAKSNSEQATKQGKTGVLLKKSGGASSSKSRSASTKSGQKSKEVDKTDGKSMDDAKATKKTEDGKGDKTKDSAPKDGSKSADVASKTTSKSKEESTSMPKPSKSKQETPRTGKSKQDTPKGSSNAKGKSNSNGAGKKSGSSKMKEAEDDDESADSGKDQENEKVKSATSSKGQGSDMKAGKKRRRGA